jgi:hypothetical protein
VTATLEGRTFDWTARFDPRSLSFRAAAAAVQLPATGRVWGPWVALDQQAEGACVGFAASHVMTSAPTYHRNVTAAYARGWYKRAQLLDEWPGEHYSGTSVLAGCLVGRERGLWTGFRWAKSTAELAAGIVDPKLGPALIGVQWSPALYATTALGVLRRDATLDPNLGHAVELFGFLPKWGTPGATAALQQEVDRLGLLPAWKSLDVPAFCLQNSWGLGFGIRGRALAPAPLVDRWLRARGEFALPEGRKKGVPFA